MQLRLPHLFLIYTANGFEVGYTALNASLREVLVSPVKKVAVDDVEFAEKGTFFHFLREAVNHARNNQFVAKLNGQGMDVCLTLNVETDEGPQKLKAYTFVSHHHTYQIGIKVPFDNLTNIGVQDMTCSMPFTGPEYLSNLKDILSQPKTVDGISYGAGTAFSQESAERFNQMVRSASGNLMASKGDAVMRRHKRFKIHQIYSSTLPKGVEEVHELKTSVHLPVYRVQLDTQRDKKLYLYFSTHFALLATVNNEGIPSSAKWIYTLHVQSLEEARAALLAQKQRMPDSYTLNMLENWLAYCDLRKKIE